MGFACSALKQDTVFQFWQRAPGLLLMPAQPWCKAESQSAERCAQTDLVIHSLWKERQKLTLFLKVSRQGHSARAWLLLLKEEAFSLGESRHHRL